MSVDPVVAERVPAALDKERLDRFLTILCSCSRKQASDLLADGVVKVNGRATTKASLRLKTEDLVELSAVPNKGPQLPEADDSIEFTVLHEDDDLLVLNKPPGLVVHPGAGNETGTLVNGLLARYPEIVHVGELHRPGIVHRLDVGTSGVMMAARTPMAYDVLVSALAVHAIHRQYTAVVWGSATNDEGTIDAPLGRSPRDPVKMAVVADGRPAVTHYQVLGRSTASDSDEAMVGVATSHVECTLETGRTHQIRVHLAAIGHPIVGDSRYGGSRHSLVFDRPALHSEELRLSHPLTGEIMSFQAPPPDDLAQLINSQLFE